jgi:hypothetical protein
MPAVRDARFVACHPDSDIVEITAEANDTCWTWRSRRSVDRASGEITFVRLDPKPPIEFMRGAWHVVAIAADEVEVILLHEFQISGQNHDMELFLERSINSNASRDLEALKAHYGAPQ